MLQHPEVSLMISDDALYNGYNTLAHSCHAGLSPGAKSPCKKLVAIQKYSQIKFVAWACHASCSCVQLHIILVVKMCCIANCCVSL